MLVRMGRGPSALLVWAAEVPGTMSRQDSRQSEAVGELQGGGQSSWTG